MKIHLSLIAAAAFLLITPSARAVTYSGRVTDNGVGVQGVTISYTWSGLPGAVTTDVNGNWSSSGWISGFAVTFSASQAGYTFSGARSFTTPI